MAAAAGLAPQPTRLTGRVNRLRAESVLIRRFREGDQDAFAELYRRHFQRVFAVCLGVLGTKHDAQDAAQEAFARAATALRQDPPRELRAWLVSVARNQSIDLLRARKAVAETSETPADPVHDPAAALSRRARLEELMTALKGLPENQRSALVLRELGGFSYAEIATSLALDEQAVNGLIARARLSLRGREESLAFDCDTIRRALSSELDGRRRPAETRRHLRNCSGCRDFHRSLRADRHAIRGLAPAPGLGLVKLLLGFKATRYAAVGSGLTAKSLLGGNAAKLVAACALCVGVFEGARELELSPLRPDGESSTRTPARDGGSAATGAAAAAATGEADPATQAGGTAGGSALRSTTDTGRSAEFQATEEGTRGELRQPWQGALAPVGSRPHRRQLAGRAPPTGDRPARREGGADGPPAQRPAPGPGPEGGTQQPPPLPEGQQPLPRQEAPVGDGPRGDRQPPPLDTAL